jgi:hypothetical protein
MAEDKKGAPTPIPRVNKDDAEDVSWALQTADTMWGRGDHADAVKWLRRAAEAASEAEADDRALELAKAAADLATQLGPIQTSPPPPPPPPPPPRPLTSRPPAPSAAPPRMFGSAPPPPPTPFPTTAARGAPPRSPAQSSAPARAPMAAARPAPMPALKPAAAVTSRGPESRRGRRASQANLDAEARRAAAKEVTITRSVETENTQEIAIPPVHTPEPSPPPKRRGRASKPAVEEVKTPPSPPVVKAAPPVPFPLPGTDEMDAWPTQSLSGDEFDAPEATRIGTPAYAEGAKRVSHPPPAPPGVSLRASQAVRVVVWRGPDGVHVAPYGTTVTAISVEAVLVALDPAADLAAWLSGK